MEETNDTISALASQLGLELPGQDSGARRTILLQSINDMIVHDFEKLVNLLYRLDVSEKKISYLLSNFPSADAADIILDLMIEREQEKMISRKKFTRDFNEGPGEEKW